MIQQYVHGKWTPKTIVVQHGVLGFCSRNEKLLPQSLIQTCPGSLYSHGLSALALEKGKQGLLCTSSRVKDSVSRLGSRHLCVNKDRAMANALFPFLNCCWDRCFLWSQQLYVTCALNY